VDKSKRNENARIRRNEDKKTSMSDRRIPSLDGARAISILLVVTFHINVVHQIPGIWRFNFGDLGVRTFFVISGFLITTLLLQERERTGSISLRGFLSAEHSESCRPITPFCSQWLYACIST
jgi:hypothetical protein